jgi:hypothetical protein
MGLAKTAEPFVCGGSAATFASVVIHPIDLAKVRPPLFGRWKPFLLSRWRFATQMTYQQANPNAGNARKKQRLPRCRLPQ